MKKFLTGIMLTLVMFVGALAFTACGASLKSIKVAADSQQKVEFVVNDNFDTTGLKITGVYSDKKEKDITDFTATAKLKNNANATEVKVGESLSSAGVYVVTVSYKKLTTTYEITVTTPATLESISATLKADKKYFVGHKASEIVAADFNVTATMSDETTNAVTSGYTLSIKKGTTVVEANDALTGDDYTVTITYQGKTCDVTVRPVEVVVESVSVTATKNELLCGETLAKADLVVVAHKNDGSQETLGNSGNEYTVTFSGDVEFGNEFTKPGEYTVTVTVGDDKTAETTVVVKNEYVTAKQDLENVIAAFTEVYNSSTQQLPNDANGGVKAYTVEQIKTALQKDLYVKVANVSNLSRQYNLTINSTTFHYNDTTSVSINYYRFVYDKVWKVQNGDLYILGNVAYLELVLGNSELVYGEFDISLSNITAHESISLRGSNVYGVKSGSGNTVTPAAEGENDYDFLFTIDNPTEWVYVGAEGLTGGFILTKSDVTYTHDYGRAIQYGATNIDDISGTYAFGMYPYPLDASMSKLYDTFEDGKIMTYTVVMYDAGQGKAVAYTCRIKVVVGGDAVTDVNAQTQNDAFKTALENGGIVKLTENVTYSGTERINITKDTVLDLGNYTLTVTGEVTSQRVLFFIKSGAKLTIKSGAEGKIDAGTNTIFYVGAASTPQNADSKGYLVIEGGTFKTGECEVVCVASGKAEILGGYFDEVALHNGKRFTLNIYNDNKQYCEIVVKGGTFKGFNPEGPTTDDLPDYVLEGYHATEHDGEWTVEKWTDGKNHVKTAKGLEDIITKQGNITVVLDADITFAAELVVSPGIGKTLTLELNGHTLTATDAATLKVKNGILRVLDSSELHTGKYVSNGYYNFVTIKSGMATGKLVIESGTFETASAHIVYVQDGSAEIKGGTFKSTYTDKTLMLNVQDGNHGTITVSGGTFEGFHVGDDNATEVQVAEGYQVNDAGDNKWTVVAND